MFHDCFSFLTIFYYIHTFVAYLLLLPNLFIRLYSSYFSYVFMTYLFKTMFTVFSFIYFDTNFFAFFIFAERFGEHCY